MEVTDELILAIEEGIAELDKGEGIPHEIVLDSLQANYPDMKFIK